MKGCQSVFRPPVRRSPGSADVLIRSGGRLITKSPPIPPPVIPTIRDPALRENRRLPQHKVGLRRLQSSAGIPPVNLKSEICNLKSLWKESTIRIAYPGTARKRLETGMGRTHRIKPPGGIAPVWSANAELSLWLVQKHAPLARPFDEPAKPY